MRRTIRLCPLCTIDDAVHCLDNTMAVVGELDMSYTLVRCIHCGFHYARQLADNATFSAYYRSVSKYDVPGALPPVDQARVDAAISFLEGRIGKSAHIADLGCGYGALLGGLKRAGWQNLEGLDPAPNAAQCALDMFGVGGIRRGMMSDAHVVLNLQEVDMVCIMCVLEHLPELKRDVAQLFSKLRPGCKVLVEVPAIEFFPNPDGEPFGEFSLEHINFFDAPSLINLMNSLGAETLALELLDLPMVASGAVFGLFEWSGAPPDDYNYVHPGTDTLNVYIGQSQKKLDSALQRVPDGPLIVYGAGSHTARLLAYLEEKTGCVVHSIVDSNPNLTGKQMGRWTVQSPDTIHLTPDIPVLVSSFRSQNAIASHLKKSAPNPLVLMYQ
jgi:SAM-dependent methyltransferase